MTEPSDFRRRRDDLLIRLVTEDLAESNPGDAGFLRGKLLPGIAWSAEMAWMNLESVAQPEVIDLAREIEVDDLAE